jgi:nitrogen fixation/metabolism regulation signal transduction histidine kinase
MCRSILLADNEAAAGGQVLVFDDVTDLMRAQRDSAWGEVARRLAHEIKNPLTPIQLSAERLRRKYLNSMDESEADVLDRATHTIVQQVESLKEMVNAFSDYARAPKINLQPLLLHNLLREVLDLYKSSEQIINTQLAQPEPLIQADAGRLRQLLHNLIKNALESASTVDNPQLLVETRWQMEAGERYVELCFEDNGGGFSQEILEHIFEPYVTTKARGTGLGMAIVKKIVEEHNGQIKAFNTGEQHARIEIRFTAAVRP